MTEKKDTDERLKSLREPFKENQISKLPKPTIALEKWKELPKAKCKECGAYHATTNTLHLAYVGHAALTDRLLDVDPDWNWQPLAVDVNGLPALDKDGGMWIKLTVCGVTRLGYGDSQGKTGCNATKERIGDALRNAAMRFGAALDLWHKGDLHVEDEGEGEGDKKPIQSIAEKVNQFLVRIDEMQNVFEANNWRVKHSVEVNALPKEVVKQITAAWGKKETELKNKEVEK